MSGEATEAAKRHFDKEHPEWRDGPPSVHSPHKHHAAPTTQTNHYVVKVCNLIGLEAVCEHGGRKAVKEQEVPHVSDRSMKKPAEAGKQEGTFVLSVIPHLEPGSLSLAPNGDSPIHNQKSIGDQTIDSRNTTEHHRFTEDKKREAAEEEKTNHKHQALNSEHTRLQSQNAHLAGQSAQAEAHSREMEKQKAALDQHAAARPVHGNLGRKKTQLIHQQRLQLQKKHEANNRQKARLARDIDANHHKQAQNAKALQGFHKDNDAHVRFNFRLYTDHAPATLVDKIMLTATMSHHCSAHPVWKVFEVDSHKMLAAHNAMTLECEHLLPPVIDETLLSKIVPHLPNKPDAYWLRHIKPRTYKIQLETCHAIKEVLIHVYPQIKSGFVITIHRDNGHLAAPADSWLGRIESYEHKFKEMLNFLHDYAPKLEDLEVSILAQGSLDFSNTWEEEEHSDEVVWKASVDADMDLIEVAFRVPIFEINPLPQAIKKWLGDFINAGIYFTFNGKVGANFAGFWTDHEHFKVERGGVKGEIAFGISGIASAGKDGMWGRLEARGTSTIGVGAEIHAKDHAFLFGMYWQFVHPFEAELTVYAPHHFEVYDWKHDLWRPGEKNYLPEMQVFGNA